MFRQNKDINKLGCKLHDELAFIRLPISDMMTYILPYDIILTIIFIAKAENHNCHCHNEYAN